MQPSKRRTKLLFEIVLVWGPFRNIDVMKRLEAATAPERIEQPRGHH